MDVQPLPSFELTALRFPGRTRITECRVQSALCIGYIYIRDTPEPR